MSGNPTSQESSNDSSSQTQAHSFVASFPAPEFRSFHARTKPQHFPGDFNTAYNIPYFLYKKWIAPEL
jgi:hypothetical protein